MTYTVLRIEFDGTGQRRWTSGHTQIHCRIQDSTAPRPDLADFENSFDPQAYATLLRGATVVRGYGLVGMEMRLSEIADRIRAHLRRIEGDEQLNPWFKMVDGKRVPDPTRMGMRAFYHSGAVSAGRYVSVTYVSYQGRSSLTRAEAIAYLEWLTAGNVGTHFKQQQSVGEKE